MKLSYGYILGVRKRIRESRVLVNNTEYGTGQDSPLFDFNVIETATNNFANENKLGEGGFGPVYKVLLFFPFFSLSLISTSTCSPWINF